MQPRLTEIHQNDALLFLGYTGGNIPQETMKGIQRCERMILDLARPRVVWRIFDRLPDGMLSGTGFCPQGADVHAMTQECSRIVLMGATLGSEVDAMLRRTQVQNMSEAIILDACASAAIENVCENLCHDIAEAVFPLYLTDRFSPGYGDFPLEQQKDLCSLLDLYRRIGVTLSPGGLMIPQKSVTALIGVSDKPQKMRFRGCSHCNSFKSCGYRKEGLFCEKL